MTRLHKINQEFKDFLKHEKLALLLTYREYVDLKTIHFLEGLEIEEVCTCIKVYETIGLNEVLAVLFEIKLKINDFSCTISALSDKTFMDSSDADTYNPYLGKGTIDFRFSRFSSYQPWKIAESLGIDEKTLNGVLYVLSERFELMEHFKLLYKNAFMRKLSEEITALKKSNPNIKDIDVSKDYKTLSYNSGAYYPTIFYKQENGELAFIPLGYKFSEMLFTNDDKFETEEFIAEELLDVDASA